jgi:hypothetical protein
MRQATVAVTTGDLPLTEQVISTGPSWMPCNGCEDHAQRLLVLQSPVAGDLRTILATLYYAVKSSAWATSPPTSPGSWATATPNPASATTWPETVDTLAPVEHLRPTASPHGATVIETAPTHDTSAGGRRHQQHQPASTMLASDFFHVDCAVTLQRIYVFFVLRAVG